MAGDCAACRVRPAAANRAACPAGSSVHALQRRVHSGQLPAWSDQLAEQLLRTTQLILELFARGPPAEGLDAMAEASPVTPPGAPHRDRAHCVPAAAPPHHTHLPCPAAAPGVIAREPAALRRPACLSSGDQPPAGPRPGAKAARALEAARRQRKSTISAPKRPPASTASMTRPHLRAANSSGYVVWRFGRAASAAAARGLRPPAPRRPGQRGAAWAPCHNEIGVLV